MFLLCSGLPIPTNQVHIHQLDSSSASNGWTPNVGTKGRLIGCWYTRRLNKSPFRIRGGSGAAPPPLPHPEFLLHLPISPRPPSYPPPNLDNFRPASASSQGAESCRLCTHLELTLGTVVSRIPCPSERPTELAGAASRTPVGLSGAFWPCPFFWWSKADHNNTPPSLIQQRYLSPNTARFHHPLGLSSALCQEIGKRNTFSETGKTHSSEKGLLNEEGPGRCPVFWNR